MFESFNSGETWEKVALCVLMVVMMACAIGIVVWR